MLQEERDKRIMKMELVYASTRDAQERVTESQAILRGLANDGGLFVPTQIPAGCADGRTWQNVLSGDSI